MIGNMKLKFQYKKKQMDTMVDKIFIVPLTHYEANMVYLTRHQGTIKNPLPIMTFNDSALPLIQRKNIHLRLPKMGLNRNTPRVVIYGPRFQGSRELMGLRVEQRCQHLYTKIKLFMVQKYDSSQLS